MIVFLNLVGVGTICWILYEHWKVKGMINNLAMKQAILQKDLHLMSEKLK